MSHIPEDAIPVFNRKYGDFGPFMETIFPGIKDKSLRERKYALEQAEEDQLVALIEDPDVCDFVTLRESPIQGKRMTFVFNRKRDRCFFIETQYGADSYCMKSKIYGSRERAMFDFNHKRISWHECLALASLSLVLPRRG